MSLNPKNIRVRLIAWYIFSLGVVHLLVGTGLYQAMSMRLHREFDEQLAAYAGCLVEMLPEHRGVDLSRVVDEMAGLHGAPHTFYTYIADPGGRVLYASSSVNPERATALRAAADVAQHQPATVRLSGSGVWRAVRREVYEDGRMAYVGYVAMPLQNVRQALGSLLFILTVFIPAVVIVASLGAWALLNRALRPLRELIETAQAIQARDVNRRIEIPKTGDEMERLTRTFNEMLDRLNRSFSQMRQFISDASHELRTPLAVLKGELELGLRNHLSSERFQEILGTCSSEISRMSRLVETLLFLSNADAEKVTLDFKPVHVVRLMEEMAQEARILAEAKQIHVEVVHGHNITVHADEMRLKQLLLNLIDNAVKYTPEGGRITLSYRSADGHVELVVADTGVGVEAQDIPRIFDRFYRADKSRSRVDGGYGLGLSICKWVAEAHRGTIHVESSPGKGSAFRVRLPLA